MTEYISSPVHFRNLIESPAWIDMKAEMMDMLEEVKSQLITVREYDELLRFQGRAEVLRDIIMLPEVILGALEEDLENPEEELEV